MEKIKKKKSVIDIIFSIAVIFFIAVCLCVIFFNVTHSYHIVDGISMQPTLNNNVQDAVLSSKIKPCKRGDIIIVEKWQRNEKGEKVYLIKRLIATGGDKVCVRLIDNEYRIVIIEKGKTEEKVLEEKYLSSYEHNKELYVSFYHTVEKNYGVKKDEFFTIPENEIFYLGDNRDDSEDCSDYGTKSKNLIVGKVDYIIYGNTQPLKQILKQMFGWGK